jgi:hypothetical protein
MKFLSIIAGLVSIALATQTPIPQVPTSGNLIHPSVRSQYYVSSRARVFSVPQLANKTSIKSSLLSRLEAYET